MRKCLLLAILLASYQLLCAQNYPEADSLKKTLASAPEDTGKVNIYTRLSHYYQRTYPDSVLAYGLPGLELAKKLHFDKGSLALLNTLAEALSVKGNDTKAQSFRFEASELAKTINNNHKASPGQLRRQEIQQFQAKLKIYALVATILVLLIIIFFLYRNNQYKQKMYALLEQQKEVIDSQKAEAQVEAALERVRARAMALHNSKDVGNAISILFTELDKLGIIILRCGMLIIEESTETMEVWTANSTREGRINQMSMRGHPLLEGAFNAWKKNESSYFYELIGNDLSNYYRALSSSAPQYDLNKENMVIEKQFSSVFFFKEGALFTFTSNPLSPQICIVLKKFAAVFGLTYRRYMDLKIAEEQMRQAVKQASLDKVRAEIASMRYTDDLQRIIPLIWHELKTLNVPFVRCGVFIVDEAMGITHAYLSTPEGQPLGVLNLREEESELTRKLIDYWRKGAVYKEHWNKEQFLNWMQSMIKLGQISNRETYQGEAVPPEMLDLHFVPFTQGMLYVGNTAPLTEDEIALVKSLADSFAIAYARYEDFKHLEDAKNKVDTTLIELKAAQAQLVQREKMASLGELTAGIAHEIQNPLNFVNNFSEVNKELISELRAEQQKQLRDIQLESNLLNDLEENIVKVTQHGKRAGSIVKGMLEHSRTSRGEKQSTDINALADEYLHLSYHGLRAKDKSFNSIIKTDFDESIGKIDIVPQDIGRLLLNLFNNAFYAVNEKQKQEKNAYEPKVSVSTKKQNGKVEISIKDNGTGIPQKIIDKIFQPFFTTKPTGEGTGLGLSLSYDIIKAHKGELKVISNEGEGTEFIIQLPVKESE